MCSLVHINNNQRSITVWACVTNRGVGRICCQEKTINGERYLGILQNFLLPSILLRFNNEEIHNVTFQDDNARPHRAIIVRNWLADQHFQTTMWPAYSPDLNIVENMWAYLAKRVNARNSTSNEILINFVNEEWNNITAQHCTNLFASLPRKLANVVERRGLRVDTN